MCKAPSNKSSAEKAPTKATTIGTANGEASKAATSGYGKRKMPKGWVLVPAEDDCDDHYKNNQITPPSGEKKRKRKQKEILDI